MITLFLGGVNGLKDANCIDKYDVNIAKENLDYEKAYEKLEDNIFAEIGPKFLPGRTLYNLKKWHQLMTMKEPENTYREEQKRDAEAMIDASAREPAKCKDGTHEKIQWLLKKYQLYKHNVGPYLTFHLNSLEYYCKHLDYGENSDSDYETDSDLE